MREKKASQEWLGTSNELLMPFVSRALWHLWKNFSMDYQVLPTREL
jgi:hypothetical protein